MEEHNQYEMLFVKLACCHGPKIEMVMIPIQLSVIGKPITQSQTQQSKCIEAEENKNIIKSE